MRLPLFALLFCSAAALAAALPPLPSEVEEDEPAARGWAELKTVLPPYPKPASLAEFPVSGATTNRFLLDADTLSIGSDGVVRYVLVVRSPSGAENVSYEGIRCETRETKYYAFGQRNGSWSPVKDAQWRYIEYREANRQHGVLFKDIVCAEAALPFTKQEIVRRLRYGAPVQHLD
jgi:hypothetical protein